MLSPLLFDQSIAACNIQDTCMKLPLNQLVKIFADVFKLSGIQ